MKLHTNTWNRWNRAEILDELRRVVVEQLGVNASDVTPVAHLRDDLNTDSLDDIEIVMGLEAAIGLELQDDEVKHVKTIGDLVDVVAAKLGDRLTDLPDAVEPPSEGPVLS